MDLILQQPPGTKEICNWEQKETTSWLSHLAKAILVSNLFTKRKDKQLQELCRCLWSVGRTVLDTKSS